MSPIVNQEAKQKYLIKQKEAYYYLYKLETIVMMKGQYLMQLYHQISICLFWLVPNTSPLVMEVNILLRWDDIFIINTTL